MYPNIVLLLTILSLLSTSLSSLASETPVLAPQESNPSTVYGFKRKVHLDIHSGSLHRNMFDGPIGTKYHLFRKMGFWRLKWLRSFAAAQLPVAKWIASDADPRMGTSLVAHFPPNTEIANALLELQENLNHLLGDHFFPQQNLHATIGSSSLDAVSEEQFNRWNADAALVADLHTKLTGVLEDIRVGAIKLPERWEHFILAVVTNGSVSSRQELVAGAEESGVRGDWGDCEVLSWKAV